MGRRASASADRGRYRRHSPRFVNSWTEVGRVHTARLIRLLLGLLLIGCNRGEPTPKEKSPAEVREPAASRPLASAGSAPSAAASAAPSSSRPKGPLNVLFVSIDSLRADMPWTGYPRAIAPNLTKLAEESVVYTNAYSVSSYTAKSVAAFLSGRYPSTLYRSGYFFANYSKANLFFSELLQEKGIRTLGWHSHMYFGRGKGLELGFDVWELVPGITFDPQTDNHVTSEKMTKLGIEVLTKSENTQKQFFAWAHYMDPHDQYIKHSESPDFGRKGRDLYDSEVFFTDLWLGRFLDFCKTQPWWKNTVLIISADHGEAFGEHDMYRHAFEIWEVLVRVPLMIKAPGAVPRRIEERRSMIDFAPTVMDLLGQPPVPSFVGESLTAEIYGAPPKHRDVIILELAEDSHNPHRRGIISGDYKLVVYDSGWKQQLFNLKEDPGESKDLAKSEPEKLAELKRIFDETWSKIPSIEAYGGAKLKSGKLSNGPMGPPKDQAPAR
jgi:arylsulfatase A-like enzyme